MLKRGLNMAGWHIIMFSTLWAVAHLLPAGEKVVKLHNEPHSYRVAQVKREVKCYFSSNEVAGSARTRKFAREIRVVLNLNDIGKIDINEGLH